MRRWAYHVGCGGRVVDPRRLMADFELSPHVVCIACQKEVALMDHVMLHPAPPYASRCACGAQINDDAASRCDDCMEGITGRAKKEER